MNGSGHGLLDSRMNAVKKFVVKHLRKDAVMYGELKDLLMAIVSGLPMATGNALLRRTIGVNNLLVQLDELGRTRLETCLRSEHPDSVIATECMNDILSNRPQGSENLGEASAYLSVALEVAMKGFRTA